MSEKKGTRNALDILHRRYIKDDPTRVASVEVERVNAQVAAMIYELRTSASLSQQQLAELVGTTQSVISRLEDADYEGHSLSMLTRISKVLKRQLLVVMLAKDPEADTLRIAFQTVLHNLRRSRGLSVEQLAKELGVSQPEVLAMERVVGYRPSPLTLHRLGKFYNIPTERLAVLAGAVKATPEVTEQASRFAAHSEPFATLTEDEKKTLDEFVSSLRQK